MLKNDEEFFMKTADEIKCESIIKSDEESACIGGSAIVDTHKKFIRSWGGKNIDENKLPSKAMGDKRLKFKDREVLPSGLESLKNVVDNANIGICIVLEDMHHAYVNKKYCEITGYSASELRKIRMAKLILTDKRESFENIYQLFFRNDNDMENSFISTIERKDGEICSIECSRAITAWKRKPAIQWIVRDITENLEKEKKIKAINKLLSNQIENITAELIASSERLRQKQRELISHKLELEKVSKELLQTNRAMSILARNIDKKKKEVEQKTAHTVLTKIVPIINDLKKQKGIQKYLAEMEVLGAYIKGLAPESDLHNKIVINLSTTEMRIAALIKNGMSSQKIADILHISLETVKTHRKKIRRKLDINNSNTNLTSYLQSVMDES
jgi:PAS domain S-box-containing protein